MMSKQKIQPEVKHGPPPGIVEAIKLSFYALKFLATRNSGKSHKITERETQVVRGQVEPGNAWERQLRRSGDSTLKQWASEQKVVRREPWQGRRSKKRRK